MKKPTSPQEYGTITEDMASTGVDHGNRAEIRSLNTDEKLGESPAALRSDQEVPPYSPGENGTFQSRIDSTHRRLKPRHIQLIGIGG